MSAHENRQFYDAKSGHILINLQILQCRHYGSYFTSITTSKRVHTVEQYTLRISENSPVYIS